MSARVGAVRGSMRGLVAVVLLSACSVYDKSLLETQSSGVPDAVGATSTGATGGTLAATSSGAGGGAADTGSGASSGGEASTPTTTTDAGTTTTSMTDTTTTSGGSGGQTSQTTGTGGSATSSGGTGGDLGTGGVSGGGGTGGTLGGGGDAGTGGCSGGCQDLCPDDPDKTDPGVCGCDIPDQGSSGCADLIDSLVHRYSFEGTGSKATDSAGTADGVVVNTTLDGSGTLTLTGGTSDEYVELPGGIVSALADATFEAWFTWAGGSNWERVFDFGDTESGAQGEQGTGNTYLFFTPRNSTTDTLQVTYSNGGFSNEVYVQGAAAFPSDVQGYVAVVVDDTNDMLSLYIDGALEGSVALAGKLSEVNDINNWLGRSQYMADAEFGGSLEEFRVYSTALSSAQVALSYAAGPDPDFLAP